MSLLTQVSIPDAFIIFFLTLGPLKAIGPFAQATRGADPALLRNMAWRATTIATVIVLVVGLLEQFSCDNGGFPWRPLPSPGGFSSCSRPFK